MCHQYHFCQCNASPSLFSQVQIWVDARDGRAHCWSANDSRGLQSPFWHSVQLWGAFEELKQGALLWDVGELKLKETEWWRWKLQSPSPHSPQRRALADRYVLISRWTQIILLILKHVRSSHVHFLFSHYGLVLQPFLSESLYWKLIFFL